LPSGVYDWIWAVQENDILWLRITRVGWGVDDTYANNLRIVGVTISLI
jgi:hypothetical protein